MAVLPIDNFELDNPSLNVENEPSRTWFIDLSAGRIQGECDGIQAVRQAAEIILRTDRFRWQIYSPASGTDYSNLIGLDSGYVSVEIQRRIRDALLMDTRIIDVTDFAFQIKNDELALSFKIITVYGEITETLEVNVQ